MKRVDVPARGRAWSEYLAATAAAVEEAAAALDLDAEERPEVSLVDWDPEAETKIAAAALYAATDLPDDQLLAHVRSLGDAERAALISAYGGTNRAGRWNAPTTDSTSCPTTELSATCSATAC
jgi:hypothetical protein